MRYRTIKSGPSAIWPEYPDAEGYLAKTVHERDPADTGLLDISGRKIYRYGDEIGFIRRDEK